MKTATVVLFLGPALLFFTIAIFSTVEYRVENGFPIPWVMLSGTVAADILWCVMAVQCGRKNFNAALRKYERFIHKLLK
jgi:hypothetical protein